MKRNIIIYKGKILIGEKSYHRYDLEGSTSNGQEPFQCLSQKPLQSVLILNTRSEANEPFRLLPKIIGANFKSCFHGEKVFVIKDNNSNFYLLHDPIQEHYHKINDLRLLNIWDIHYKNMEIYFKKSLKFLHDQSQDLYYKIADFETHKIDGQLKENLIFNDQFSIHYLTKKEIEH